MKFCNMYPEDFDCHSTCSHCVLAPKLYRPSNGCEGDVFMEKFCDKCDESNGDLGCEIQTRSMAFNIGEVGYPSEWIYGEDDSPICINFIELEA